MRFFLNPEQTLNSNTLLDHYHIFWENIQSYYAPLFHRLKSSNQINHNTKIISQKIKSLFTSALPNWIHTLLAVNSHFAFCLLPTHMLVTTQSPNDLTLRQQHHFFFFSISQIHNLPHLLSGLENLTSSSAYLFFSLP